MGSWGVGGGGHITHWGWVRHICMGKLTIIGSDNGLLPGLCQAIIWINAGILSIAPIGTIFNEILIEIHIFHSRKSISKCCLENVSHLSRPQCVKNHHQWLGDKLLTKPMMIKMSNTSTGTMLLQCIYDMYIYCKQWIHTPLYRTST